MAVLAIRHVPESDPPRFYLQGTRGKATAPVEVLPPGGFPVEGRANSGLVRELGWYLETFLEYPFSPETEHAERVLAALRAWGEQAFDALFGDRDGGTLFAKATAGGYEELLLQVWSDDARILGWPWEALRDPKIGAPLAASCRIERRLNDVADPAPVPAGLPTDRVNILLVIARPLDGDVKYRSIARPLVELIEKEGLLAHVHVLRPPTFDRLREHLGKRPGYYHLVHFDGHGNHGKRSSAAGEHAYGAAEGELVFETVDGQAAPITAEKLSALLREHKVPGVVLNACRSAMHEEDSEDPFASVAAALLRAGTRSVVAMSYSLYVSGAQQFLPAFYRRLFERGSFAEAARAGRQQMFQESGRVCVRGRYELEDWLVPVVYQQEEAEALSFKATGDASVSRRTLSKEAMDGENPYGFVGRDGTILEIERALRRPVPAILIHGLGGVGKTTLARGVVEWLAATEGLGEGCIWLSFQEIRSAEYVLNHIGERLFGSAFGAGAIEEKIEQLAAELRKRRHILIWDNFEVVAGIKEFAATLSEADRGHLKAFLRRLRGGATKVIITSRSDESWLGSEQRRKVELGGLDGEERWTYANAILGHLGITIDREDKDLVELMKLLDGHPLAMRVVLPRLEKQRAGELCSALRSNLSSLGEGVDEAQKKLYATDVMRSLIEALSPLDLHEQLDRHSISLPAQKSDSVASARPAISSDFELMQRRVIDSLVFQASSAPNPWISGRRLRATVPGVEPGRVSTIVKTLLPHWIESIGHPPNDIFRLTFEGLLASTATSRVRDVIERVHGYLCTRFRADPDFPNFTWDELKNGLDFTDDEFGFVNAAIMASEMMSGSSGSVATDPTSGTRRVHQSWGTPANIEELDSLSTLDKLIDYVRRRQPTSRISMSLKQDAGRVLHAIAEFEESPGDARRGRHNLTGHGIQQELKIQQECDMDPDRINDAVKVLEQNGYIDVRRSTGTFPYRFRGAQLTPAGRLEYEDMKERSSASSENASSTNITTEPKEKSMHKPRIFVGSSVEGLPVAEAIQFGLDHHAECTLWSQGVFGLSGGTLDSLIRASKDYEFAVLVLTPDDLVHKRDVTKNSPRDNVLFELGLFIGALGRERTYITYCRDEKLDLPSDLAGVTPATFAKRSDGNLVAALGSVCTLIKSAIKAAQAPK